MTDRTAEQEAREIVQKVAGGVWPADFSATAQDRVVAAITAALQRRDDQHEAAQAKIAEWEKWSEENGPLIGATLVQAEAQVRALRRLGNYITHHDDCRGPEGAICTCGFSAILADAEIAAALATPPAPCPPHRPVLGGTCQCGRVKWLAPAEEK